MQTLRMRRPAAVLLVALSVAATAPGCSSPGSKLSICGTADWEARSAGASADAVHVIDVDFNAKPEFSDAMKLVDSAAFTAVTLEVVATGEGNVATRAAGRLEVGPSDGSARLLAGEYRDLPLARGAQQEIVLNETGRQLVEEELKGGAHAFKAWISGSVDSVPARFGLRATFTVQATIAGGGAKRDLGCVPLRVTESPPPAAGGVGLAQPAFGVWDRSGYLKVTDYPVTRGQGYAETWANVNPDKGVYRWAPLDAQLAFADAQNQSFSVQISPIGGAKGSSMPAFLFAAGVPKVTDGTYTYGYYLDPTYKAYFSELVQALAKHLRKEVPPDLQARIAFVRCDTGATGDEGPYEEPARVSPGELRISPAQWQAFRLWAFEVYRQAFQEGPGPVLPLLFQDVEKTGYPSEWNWVRGHVVGGFGAKYGGQVRGHHLTESQEVTDAFKDAALAPGSTLFSRNEMDQTWSKPFFQLNLGLNMYWAAVEQLHAGLGIWDVTQSCLERTSADGLAQDFEFFNRWAAQRDPARAGGGFSIFHEGLDSSDTGKFPEAAYGAANKGNTQRYTAICRAYQDQGARMDDLEAATKGQVAQRDSQRGFNDSGWRIVPGNYERFITQLKPDATSRALWRVNGPLAKTSHRYDRFARRFDHASGRDSMYFDVHDKLLSSPGQRLQLAVDYLDRGTGRFALQYDAVGNHQKTAFTVTKANTNTWKRQAVEVTDWACQNQGPSGADLVLVSLDAEDDILHGLEVVKLADVTVEVVGKGQVTARSNAITYAPVVGTFMQGQRLELAATPDPGWVFVGWSGDLAGTNRRPFLFPTRTTRVTATFAPGP